MLPDLVIVVLVIDSLLIRISHRERRCGKTAAESCRARTKSNSFIRPGRSIIDQFVDGIAFRSLVVEADEVGRKIRETGGNVRLRINENSQDVSIG